MDPVFPPPQRGELVFRKSLRRGHLSNRCLKIKHIVVGICRRRVHSYILMQEAYLARLKTTQGAGVDGAACDRAENQLPFAELFLGERNDVPNK